MMGLMVLGERKSVMAGARVRRLVLLGSASVMLLTVTACSSSPHSQLASAAAPNVKSSAAAPNVKSSAAAPSPTATKEPIVSLAGTTAKISYQKPVKISIADGSFTSVQVSAVSGGDELDGQVSGDGLSWSSATPPKPASSYKAVAQVTDASGKVKTKTVTFKVASVPDSKKASFTVTPSDGSVVGIGQPIVVRFLSPVTQRAAVEKKMEVGALTPSGHTVTGSWHWLNSQQLDWRPENFWAPGTKVTLDMKIAGVKVSASRYGRKDYSQSFTIGASHITRVDASSHRMRVYRDGKLVNTWSTGTGRHGLETYSGTYVVLGKSSVVQMDSCSARVTCDKKNPDYYDEKEYWATRLTSSGTFVHAASWDGMLGRANVSHGCIHLSDTNAKTFYSHAVVGDVVIVSHTGRGPQQRIATQDPGLYDWNISWAAWKAGSALK
jgi:lipoprotein-anchoring transpeptidase ErfK/SrfK